MQNWTAKYILLFVFIVSVTCNSRVQAQKKWERQQKQKFEEAQYYYQFDDYRSAFPVFLELYYYDSLNIEVNFKLGVCYFNTIRNFTGAQKYFEIGKADFPDSYFYLGRINHINGKFDDAIEAFQHYKNQSVIKDFDNEEVDYYMDKSITAKQLITVKENVQIKNLGTPVNSPYPEYVPVISSDESMMLFTSRRKGGTGDLKDPNGEYFEDIYVSTNKLGMWSEPVNLGVPVNSNTHDACISLTQDGQHLFMYRTNRAQTGGDIYTTTMIDNTWTAPVIMDAEVNSQSGITTSVCLSPDENILYFSSNRAEGYGGLDLYMVKKLPTGKWSLPQNLGPAINSPYDDDAPFIHPDGKTMYFSSKGNKNMGGYDIFRSEIQDDDKWSAPENLGYPINSVRDDIYFVVTADRKKGYFSSNRDGGVGNSDIYTVSMPDVIENRILLKGTVTTNNPVFSVVKSTITIIDYETKELQGIYRTNSKTGKFLMVLFPGKKYKMVVEADGFNSYVDDIDLSKRLSMNDLNKHINLERIIKEMIDPIQIERDSIMNAQQDSINNIK